MAASKKPIYICIKTLKMGSCTRTFTKGKEYEKVSGYKGLFHFVDDRGLLHSASEDFISIYFKLKL